MIKVSFINYRGAIKEMKQKLKDTNKKSRAGFSLIEALLSLFLFFIITFASLEFFLSLKAHFFKIKEDEEMRLAAFVALDKMRIDFLEGGLGLLEPLKLGIFRAIYSNNEVITIRSKQDELILLSDALQGETRLSLKPPKDISKGREICIFNPFRGEVKNISTFDKESITLNSPLQSSYLKENSTVILIKQIFLSLEEKTGILRRKVNTSSAQPLLEDIEIFESDYEEKKNLVKIRLILKPQKEKEYEALIFPKNLALISF